MKKVYLFILLLVLLSVNTYAQQTVGLFMNSPQSFNGYTLFAPIPSEITYLINNCGEKVHSWSSQYQPGLSCYLMENGVLLRTGRISGPGGGSGIVEMIDWNGNVIWDYSISLALGKQHHDIELLPNGNILFIVSEERSQGEVVQAGGSTLFSEIKSEQIIEVQPDLVSGGGTVVWEWKVWDHLIQDADASKDNYGTVSQRPERVDVNFLSPIRAEWLHVNGVDYNAEFDQIIISVHNFSEFWIIDHSTTTAEAAGSTAGFYGKGGDLLYRWGNPQTYDQGTANDQKLFLQHHTHWIPDSHPDGGKIMLFNNQAGTLQGQDYSTVDIVDLPVDSDGFYTYNGTAYAPLDFDWTYKAPNPTDFYSRIISGVQRLENGNTLICQGVGGRFFEIDENKDIVWEYINPVKIIGPITQGTVIDGDNNVFRCVRYAPDYPGFDGNTLIPQGYIEIGSTFSCDLYTEVISIPNSTNNSYVVYPNPAINNISIERVDNLTGDLKIEFYSIIGQRLMSETWNREDSIFKISVSNFSSGVYFIKISNKSEIWTEKIIVLK